MEENLESAVKECEENKFYVKVSFVFGRTVVVRLVLSSRLRQVDFPGGLVTCHSHLFTRRVQNFSEVFITVG